MRHSDLFISPCANPKKAGRSAWTNKGTKTFYYAIKRNDDNILRGTKEFVKRSFRSQRIDRLAAKKKNPLKRSSTKHIIASLREIISIEQTFIFPCLLCNYQFPVVSTF